jgi:hypothetical protein
VPYIVADGDFNSAVAEVRGGKLERQGAAGPDYPDGCDETELLVGGVTVGHLATLVMDGFATMRATLRAGAAGREKSVVWMKITAAGLEAAAE